MSDSVYAAHAKKVADAEKECTMALQELNARKHTMDAKTYEALRQKLDFQRRAAVWEAENSIYWH